MVDLDDLTALDQLVELVLRSVAGEPCRLHNVEKLSPPTAEINRTTTTVARTNVATDGPREDGLCDPTAQPTAPFGWAVGAVVTT